MTSLHRRVSLSALLLSCCLGAALAACGDDVVPPPTDLDANVPDSGPQDAALDAGRRDAFECPDFDGDGYGAPPCGDDCDDTLNTVNPGAAEQCNGGIDDDCDGLGDAEEAVCSPCPAGFRGIGTACADVDECAIGGFCGSGATGCLNLPGSFTCTCGPGYHTATPIGALCENNDECAASTNPCGVGVCVDNAGSYFCACPAGYRLAASPALTCVDIDECAEETDLCTTAPTSACANTPGAYACSCPAGYEGSGRGSAGCLDVDECVRGMDDCDAVGATCVNEVGRFGCPCQAGFAGAGHGADGCLWSDPSLLGLVLGAGDTLSPAFSPSTTTYTVTLLPGEASMRMTPTVVWPTRARITIDGILVAPGATTVVPIGLSPTVVEVVVTTETGATRRYAFAVLRRSVYVKGSNAEAGDGFGLSVSLSGDGNRLAVGALYEGSSATGVDGDESDNNALLSGAVYVFSREGATWSQEAYLKASNTEADDYFGYAVSLSADGTRLAVGAVGEDSSGVGVGSDQNDNSALTSGAAYVFQRTGATWTQEAYVKASNTGASDWFGCSVALSADGSRLAVGAKVESSGATGVDGDQADDSANSSGAAYVFSRTGVSWSQDAYLKASNTGATDSFGGAVSLSADGLRLAVGAVWESSSATGIDGDASDDGARFSGAAYVFSRTGPLWRQEAYIKASNTDAMDFFGHALSLSPDGRRLAVGAVGEGSTATGVGGDQSNDGAYNVGAAYVFSRTGTIWEQEAYIKASNAASMDTFGCSLSLSADGAHLSVGAYGEASRATGINGDQTDDSAGNSGAAYGFSRTGTTWAQEAYVKASNTESADYFGQSLSLSADGAYLAVGAWGEASTARGIAGDETDNSASFSGAVYVY